MIDPVRMTEQRARFLSEGVFIATAAGHPARSAFPLADFLMRRSRMREGMRQLLNGRAKFFPGAPQ
jgi:hypothetical protein